MPTDPAVLCLCRDLLFQSKITATARSAGVSFQVLRDANLLTDQPARLLLVDLNQPAALEAAARWRAATDGAVVGFVSHVDAATVTAARAAGLTEVLARSAFTDRLAAIIAGAADR
jgi:DNA-binding NarL/FixJ family response regulator